MDVVVVAQLVDPGFGVGEPRSGAPVLATEDQRDRRVVVVLGETPHELDGALVGLSPRCAEPGQLRRRSRHRPALPGQLQLGAMGLAVDGDHHLDEEHTQELLALPDGRALRLEDGTQIRPGLFQPGDLFGTERAPAAGLLG